MNGSLTVAEFIRTAIKSGVIIPQLFRTVADDTARDAITGDDLTALNNNSNLVVRVTDSASAGGGTAYYNRLNSAWNDVTFLIQGPQGQSGAATDFSSLTAYEIMMAGADPDNSPVNSGIRRLSNGTGDYEFDATAIFPRASIQIGQGGVYSGLGALLMGKSFVTGRSFTFPFIYYDKNSGTDALVVPNSQNNERVDGQNDDSSNVASTGTFSVTTTAAEVISAIYLRCVDGGSITGLRFRATIQGQSVPFFYYPSRSSYEAGEGEDIPDSGNTPNEHMIDLIDAPMFVLEGQTINFEYTIDSGQLLGNSSGVPFYAVDRNVTSLDNVAMAADIRTDEQIQDLMDSTLVGGTNVTLVYDDAAGTITINSTASGGTFNAPRITNFAIQGLPSRVNENTDLNVQRTITFDIMHASNIQGDLTLEVTTGDNITLTGPFTDGTNTRSVTFSGIDSSSAGTLTNQITGTDTQSGAIASNTITTEIRTLDEHEYFYYGLSSTNNPSTIDTTGMTNVEATTGSHIIATGAVTSGQYFILLAPTDHDVASITDDVLQQNVTDIFTRTEDVRQINGINYHSYVIGPLNAINTENYTIVLN